MTTTFNINRTLLRSACLIAIDFVKDKRKQTLESLVDRALSWQKQGAISKLLGRTWAPPTRDEMRNMIVNEGLLGFEYRCIQHDYGKMLSVAETLLIAIEWTEDPTISVGIKEFSYLQSFFPEASK